MSAAAPASAIETTAAIDVASPVLAVAPPLETVERDAFAALVPFVSFAVFAAVPSEDPAWDLL